MIYSKIISSNNEFFYVDEKYASFFEKFKWTSCPRKNGLIYFKTSLHGKNIYAHRLMMVFFGSVHIDHINRKTKDNYLSNLRVTTHTGNIVNAEKKRISKYRGIYRHRKKWVAQLQSGGSLYKKRGFETQEDAAKAYDEMALKYHGITAIINFPKGDL